MSDQILIIDADTDRRAGLRAALERRGATITGEASCIADVINAVANLEEAPTTVLVGREIVGASSARVARLMKRTWPKAVVIHEMNPQERAMHAEPRHLRIATAV